MAEEKNDISSSYIQMAKLSGRDSFVEFLNKGFPIGKIMVNVMKYNSNGNKGSKMMYEIHGYVDIPEFLYLASIIKWLTPSKLSKIEKDTEIWKSQGGTNAKNAKRADGMAESRTLKIIRGQKADFMFVGTKGPGEVNETGLIIPKGKSEANVMVAMSLADILKTVIFIEYHIQSYLTSCYLEVNKYWKINDYFSKQQNNKESDKTDKIPNEDNYSQIIVTSNVSESEFNIQLEHVLQIFKDYFIDEIQNDSYILRINQNVYLLKPGFTKSSVKQLNQIFGDKSVKIRKK